jgi:hypothetical protein
MSSANLANEPSHPTVQMDAVEAPINYLAPMDEKPYSYNYAPAAGTTLTNRRVARESVTIRNARPIQDRLSLDREGFALAHGHSAVSNFYDDAEVKRVYYPECERLLKEATGATRVLVFDHIVRNAARAKVEKGIKLPAKGAHNDYTQRSAPQRVCNFFSGQADELLKHRFAIINVWRPISGPVKESPFAICDASSISPSDFVASDLLYPDRKGETYAVTFNPNHRWYYLPDMEPDEAILLKCYDSDQKRAQMTAHTGFDDPNSPPDAPPRESIETRAFVFLGPKSSDVG